MPGDNCQVSVGVGLCQPSEVKQISSNKNQCSFSTPVHTCQVVYCFTGINRYTFCGLELQRLVICDHCNISWGH